MDAELFQVSEKYSSISTGIIKTKIYHYQNVLISLPSKNSIISVLT